MHHSIPAVLHRDEPWLHRHSENGALANGDCVVCFANSLDPDEAQQKGQYVANAVLILFV